MKQNNVFRLVASGTSGTNPSGDGTRPASTPARLVGEVLKTLEDRFGSDAREECLKLLQVSELLARAERALFVNPAKEWPRWHSA